MKLLIYIFTPIIIILSGAIFYSFHVSTPLYSTKLIPSQLNTISIAPFEEALTFARANVDGKTVVMLVTQYEHNMLSGINLNQAISSRLQDPIEMFNKVGYETLQQILVNKHSHEVVTVVMNELLIPIDTQANNIGVGGNYVEHVKESGLANKPVFVFPKRVQPTLFNSSINGQIHGRLDYEVELGLVPLNILTVSDNSPEYLGFILCNDFTDRLALVKDIDQGLPMGTTGFARAKGQLGFLPVGNLFVIPRDYQAFLEKVELKLYVNDRLRQSEIAANMLAKPQDILKLIFNNNKLSFYVNGSQKTLLDSNVIPKGTIILSGTPAGVVFRIANVLNPMVYLQEKDNVTIKAGYLGTVVTNIF